MTARNLVGVRLDQEVIDYLKDMEKITNMSPAETIRQCIEKELGEGIRFSTYLKINGNYKEAFKNKEIRLPIHKNTFYNMPNDEDAVKLALSFADLIKPFTEDNSIVRQILKVDNLPEGTLARYKKNKKEDVLVCVRYSDGRTIIDKIIEGEEVLIPTYEIVDSESIYVNFSEETNIDFEKLEERIKTACINIIKNEEIDFIKLILQTTKNTDIAKLQDAPRAAMIFQNINAILLNGSNISNFVEICKNDNLKNIIKLSSIENIDKNYRGIIGTCGKDGKIIVSNACPNQFVFLFKGKTKEETGVFPIRQPLSVIPTSDIKKRKTFFVAFEEIAMLIQRDHVIALEI